MELKYLWYFLAIAVFVFSRFFVRYWVARNGAGRQRRRFVKRIFVYPIKSCRGVELDQCALGRYGFRDDRRWMLVDERGVFVSQREQPRLALVDIRYSNDDSFLHINYPDMPELMLQRDNELTVENVTVRIWDDDIVAQCEAAPINEWFSRVLNQNVRLVRVAARGFVRKQNPSLARPGAPGDTGFADGMPYLFLSQQSLDGLRKQLPEKYASFADVRRFRPNVLVDGCSAPNEEDHWGTLLINGVTFYGMRECTRCRETTVDPQRGEFSGEEPLSTLRRYRAPLKDDGSRDVVPVFAMNMSHKLATTNDERLSIKVGDEIDIIDFRDPKPLAPAIPQRRKE